MKNIKVLICLVAFAVCGCAAVQHNAKPQQKLDKPLLAGVGDVVLRLNKQRNLENAFGKSDLFGRKTNEGYIEIRFSGVESSGEIVLARKDLEIVSNETTMSRTPFSQIIGWANTSTSGSVYDAGNSSTFNGTASTNYQSSIISPPSDYHVVVPSDSIAIRLAPGEESLPVGGFVLRIVRATPNSLEYTITQQ